MNLISCKNCGVVLDRDVLLFPEIYDHDTQELVPNTAVWDGDDYVAILPCPICDGLIREDGK